MHGWGEAQSLNIYVLSMALSAEAKPVLGCQDQRGRVLSDSN